MYRVEKKEFYGEGEFTYKPISPLFETKKKLIDMQINVLNERPVHMLDNFPDYIMSEDIISEEGYKDLTEWAEENAYYVIRTFGLENVQEIKFAEKYRKLCKSIGGLGNYEDR